MKFDGLMWWISRWRRSTAFVELTLEQQGAYRNLLDEATLRGGPLPADEGMLAKACGDPRRWPKIRGPVLKRFTLDAAGMYRNETLDQVLRETTRRMSERAQQRERARRYRARHRDEGRDEDRDGGRDGGRDD